MCRKITPTVDKPFPCKVLKNTWTLSQRSYSYCLTSWHLPSVVRDLRQRGTTSSKTQTIQYTKKNPKKVTWNKLGSTWCLPSTRLTSALQDCFSRLVLCNTNIRTLDKALEFKQKLASLLGVPDETPGTNLQK